MNRIFKVALKELGTLLVALVAIALVWPWIWVWIFPISLLTVGATYTLLKPFYDYRGRPRRERLLRVGKWSLNVLYQIWAIFRYIFLSAGYIIDLFGCVLLGELIEDLVTDVEQTLFGLGDITISAALGDLKRRGAFRTHVIFGKEICIGLILCNILSALDPVHEDHCIAAIELYEFKKNQK